MSIYLTFIKTWTKHLIKKSMKRSSFNLNYRITLTQSFNSLYTFLIKIDVKYFFCLFTFQRKSIARNFGEIVDLIAVKQKLKKNIRSTKNPFYFMYHKFSRHMITMQVHLSAVSVISAACT